MKRVEFTFKRALSETEIELLQLLITWRKGSAVYRDEVGQVTGAIAHPDDIRQFEFELGKRIVRRKVNAQTSMRVDS